MATRQEARRSGTDEGTYDRPSAVSESGGDESRKRKHTCVELYRWLSPALRSKPPAHAVMRATLAPLCVKTRLAAGS
jgi:hypothetical protein